MKHERFNGQLLAGHKDYAIEVPFDPTERWGVPARQLWRGRRGHGVCGQLNGVAFESVVVPRSRRYFLLVPDELRTTHGLSDGDTVRIAIAPVGDDVASRPR